ncbi:MAG: CinA family protein [Fibrobacterota bacterium]
MSILHNSVEEIGRILCAAASTLAVAESCTGGMIGSEITSLSGVSSWFRGGVIAYENRIKEDVLAVSRQSLQSFGAVSPAVAGEMARGVRNLFSSTWGLSVTGIAGPGGGTLEKPVGTVCIAVVFQDSTWEYTHHFGGDRHTVREHTTLHALRHLQWHGQKHSL